jgi:hypothetical protein
MADEVIHYNVPAQGTRPDLLLMKQISWAAIFAGVLVALAVEVLFLSFGFFVGFRLSPHGASLWSAIWYWAGCFCSLLAGGWVAARLAGNPQHGRVHGIVTWGLATVLTFIFLTFMSWGVVSQTLGIVRTAALTTAAEVAAANRLAPNDADRLMNQADAAATQAQRRSPYLAQAVERDISNAALVLWIGFVIAACGAIVGGVVGVPKTAVITEPSL